MVHSSWRAVSLPPAGLLRYPERSLHRQGRGYDANSGATENCPRLLAAADREFENGNVVAGTERLWDAITHTLTAIADAKGWSYDAGDLFSVVQKLADGDGQVGDILKGKYSAAKSHPGLVRAEYFRFEYGDTHRARRLAREFIDTVLALAAQSDKAALCLGDDMLTHKELKTAQDYLNAADREFENANALAATERLWDAMALSLTTVADERVGPMTRPISTRWWRKSPRWTHK